jgi:WD40 repeat protein
MSSRSFSQVAASLATALVLLPASIVRAEPPAVDRYGDPLPRGGIMRLGSARLRHLNYIASLTFSPDNRTLVSVGHDAIRAWDVTTARALPLFGREGDSPFCAVYLPDGNALAAGYHDEIVLWDLNRRPLRRFKDAVGRGASLLAVSPDGKTLAAAVNFNGPPVIRLWSVSSGEQLAELAGTSWDVSGLSFSPDNRYLVACSSPHWGGDGNQVSLWELPGLRPKWQFSCLGGVSSASFFPDSKTIALGSPRGRIRYLSAANGKERESPKRDGRLVAVSPDGKTLAVASSNTTLSLCDSATGRERCNCRAHGSTILELTFSRDGKYVASGSRDGTVILWDAATGRELHPLGGHRYRSGAVAFSPDGRAVVSRGGDQTLRAWDLHSGNESLRLNAGSQEDWVAESSPDVNLSHSLAYSADGKLLASWDHGHRSIGVWEAQSGKKKCFLEGHGSRITCLGFSPTGNALASVDRRGEVRLWDVTQGRLTRLLASPPPGRRAPLDRVIAFSSDGQKLAVTSQDGLAVYDLSARKRHLIARLYPSSLVFLAKNKLIAAAVPSVGSAGRPAIEVLVTDTGRRIRTFDCETKNHGSGGGRLMLALSPDGRYLAAADGRYHTSADQADWDAKVWDLFAGQPVLVLSGHQGPVNGIAFAPDSIKLATAGEDGTVIVWDMLALSAEQEKRGHRGIDELELGCLYSDLESLDAVKAFHAMVLLAHYPDRSVPLFQNRLARLVKREQKGIKRLLADLDAEQFEVREAATRELRDFGIDLAGDLDLALAGKPSAEMRRRLEDLLNDVRNETPSPDALRRERMLTVLEWMATNDAVALLRRLAQGVPDGALSSRANSALERLGRLHPERRE